jgi:hypothetical protein
VSTPVEEAIAALEAARVRYIIVGGVAVVLHGHLRATGDLDLVIDLSEDNARRAIEALVALGYRPRAPVAAESFADPSARAGWIRDKNMVVFSMWRRLGDLEIDLFVNEPFDFEAVLQRAVRVELEHSEATVLALADLILLKRGAGPPQDLADIAALEELEEDGMAEGFDDGFEGTRRRQAQQARGMTHVERLRWLEAKRRELLRLLGLASPQRRNPPADTNRPPG